MALLDPTDLGRSNGDAHGPTTRPRLCLLAGFGFIVGTALLVHIAFNALV